MTGDMKRGGAALAILTLAVVVSVAVIAYLYARSANTDLRADLALPDSPALPSPSTMPNPQPTPLPLPTPR